MDVEQLAEKIKRLEFHQSLLMMMLSNSEYSFYHYVIESSLTKDDFRQFHDLCIGLNQQLEDQKAEGFIHFQSLFQEFKENLHKNLEVDIVIETCLRQQLYVPLMREFKNYIEN